MPPSPLITARTEWILPDRIEPASGYHQLDASKLVAAILYRRGITSVEQAAAFTSPLTLPLPDPQRLPNISAAVARLQQAVTKRETIAIFGDYDVDGITSTLILSEALSHALGPDRVITRLPERGEGYGLNAAAVEEFHAAGVALVIAVDCGSSDHEHVARLANYNIDVLVLDHHHMRDAGPPEAIVVSPQLGDDPHLHELTGVGIAFLAMLALHESGVSVTDAPEGPHTWLDLVALGTVADVASVAGINRGLVARGIQQIRTKPRPGLAALLQIAQVVPDTVTCSTVSFALSPRLNAAGRMDSPKLAYDLLAASDRLRARQLATLLEQVNIKRKSRASQLHAEAFSQIVSDPNWETAPLFALQKKNWEAGLVGAVASRLAEDVRRPVLLFHERDGLLHGSGRSVEGFNLIESLHEIAASLGRFGGHSLAAGLTLTSDNLAALVQHLTASIRATGLDIPAPRQLRIDAKVPPEYLTIASVNDMARPEPVGQGNPQPVLMVERAELTKYSAMGSDRSHLKLHLKCGSRRIEAVAWGAGNRSMELVGARHVDVVGTLEINRWNGSERLQMIATDFRVA